MVLFDDFERTDREPRRNAESTFAFFNRSAWRRSHRIRQVLQEWFDRFPTEHQNELCGRLRSKDEFPYYTAVFELILHELLLKQGQVTVHPEADWGTSTRVDFLVTPDAGKPYLVEAVTLFGESEDSQKASRIVETLYDAVNQVNSPDFFVHVRVEGAARRQPSSKHLREFLRKKLETLDYDEVCRKLASGGISSIDEWVYEVDGLTLSFRPTPKGPENRGKPGVRTLGMRSGSFRWGGMVDELREQVRQKAKKYGNPPMPLVVAINVLHWSYDGDTELAQALFGTVREVVQVSWPSGDVQGEPVAQSQLVQDRDGLLYDGERPHHREVSAVLVFDGLAPSSLGAVRSRLFLNPFANHALTTGLAGFPRAVLQEGQFTFEDGTPVVEMLGLPADWPDTEEGQG